MGRERERARRSQRGKARRGTWSSWNFLSSSSMVLRVCWFFSRSAGTEQHRVRVCRGV